MVPTQFYIHTGRLHPAWGKVKYPARIYSSGIF
jgi:hypothetical protein